MHRQTNPVVWRRVMRLLPPPLPPGAVVDGLRSSAGVDLRWAGVVLDPGRVEAVEERLRGLHGSGELRLGPEWAEFLAWTLAWSASKLPRVWALLRELLGRPMGLAPLPGWAHARLAEVQARFPEQPGLLPLAWWLWTELMLLEDPAALVNPLDLDRIAARFSVVMWTRRRRWCRRWWRRMCLSGWLARGWRCR